MPWGKFKRCSFKNLNPDSQLTEEEKELLEMYEWIVE
jgi:hypothetical protein